MEILEGLLDKFKTELRETETARAQRSRPVMARGGQRISLAMSLEARTAVWRRCLLAPLDARNERRFRTQPRGWHRIPPVHLRAWSPHLGAGPRATRFESWQLPGDPPWERALLNR